MGTKSADAYDLGVGLGIASVQSALGQTLLAHTALGSARPSADALVIHLLLDPIIFNSVYSNNVSQGHLVQVRQAVDTDIGRHSGAVSNAYRLGLLIAMAEGQAIATWSQSWSLAEDALKQVHGLITGPLQNVPLDPVLIQTALAASDSAVKNQNNAYFAILTMRISYRKEILATPTLP